MKRKRKKIICAAVLCGLMLFLAGCSQKTAITAEEFAQRMEKQGFLVGEPVSGSEYEGGLLTFEYRHKEDMITVTKAAKSFLFTAEFYVWKDAETAQEWFENICKAAYSSQQMGMTEIKEEIREEDYCKIVLQSKAGYGFNARIGNTTMQISAPIKNKDDVEKAMKATGY